MSHQEHITTTDETFALTPMPENLPIAVDHDASPDTQDPGRLERFRATFGRILDNAGVDFVSNPNRFHI